MDMSMKQRIWKIGLLMFLSGFFVNRTFAQECKELLGEKDGKYYFQNGTIITAKDQQTAIATYNDIKKGNEYFSNGYKNFVEGNYKSAIEWYNKALKLGNTDASCNLGYCYEHGLGVEKDKYKAFECYMQSAQVGDAIAQFNVARMFEYDKKYEEAVEFYEKAAKQGHMTSQRKLGNYYFYGRGVRRNYTTAVQWYEKAAKQGDKEAQIDIAECYYDGAGVAQNYLRAVKWYVVAANQGSSDAQYQLGYMYSEGLGVTRDYTESIRWYRKAADNGDADAIFCLANKYYNGQGVTQDYDKALELYHKAADKGVYQAMYVISECYTYGRGVKKDLNQANYWKQKAKELENKNK